MHFSTFLRYFTLGFTFNATSAFNSLHFRREILSFLLVYIYLIAVVSSCFSYKDNKYVWL